MTLGQISIADPHPTRYGLGFASVVTLFGLFGMLALFGELVAASGFIDTDNFTRLAKLRQFWSQGGWFDPMQHRINPPQGHSTHWTKPLDILLLAGALPLTPVIGFERALNIWAVMIAPISYVLLVYLAPWMCRPLLGGRRDWLAAAIMASQWSSIINLTFGRPDHNIILLACWMLTIGLTLRILRNDPGMRPMIWLSATLALGIWTSVEFLFAMSAVLVMFGLGWLFRRPRMAALGLGISGGVLVGLIVALVIEKGPGRLGEFTLDQISWPFLVMVFFVSLAWVPLYLIERLERPSRPLPRAAIATGAVVAAAIAIWWIAPELFAGPGSIVDPLYKVTRLDRILEYLPIVSPERFGWVNNLGRAIFALSFPAIAIIATVVFLIRSDQADRLGLGFVYCAGLGFFMIQAYQGVHWNFYATAISVPVMVRLIRATLVSIGNMRVPPAAMLTRSVLMVGLLIGPMMVGGILMQWGSSAVSDVAYRRCGYDEVIGTLNDPAGIGASAKRVIAFVDFNPEILYRTRHYVYSAPNHRPQPGYTQTYELMAESDMAAVPGRLTEMRAEYLLICIDNSERAFYRTFSQTRNFHDRLVGSEMFFFLRPVRLPPKAGYLRLYKVILPGQQ